MEYDKAKEQVTTLEQEISTINLKVENLEKECSHNQETIDD